MNTPVIAIAGNPNSGKTTLFNALTGARQRVGNWPGVTVEKKTGNCVVEGQELELIDLPGIYSFSASSVDESIARDFLVSGNADLVVNIVDATSLERGLLLTMQLLEMGVPVVVAANMMDLVKERNLQLDIDGLTRELDCPVVPMTASKGKGLKALKSILLETVLNPKISKEPITPPKAIKQVLPEISAMLGENAKQSLRDQRSQDWFCQNLIETEQEYGTEQGLTDSAQSELLVLRAKLATELGEEPDLVMSDLRYGRVREITRQTVNRAREVSRTLTDRIDALVLNRVLAIPVFLLAMYLTFMVTINVGGAFIDFFDQFTGAITVDGFRAVLEALGLPALLVTLLADGVGGGIQTVATFIPPIFFMFLCLTLLEDSGYMARAAFVMDRLMRAVGLPGKAMIPMMVGFGCSVPAVMATRTLEDRRERTLTAMMAPMMSCGARLPVYALFAAAFFPVQGQNVVFALYLIGILMAVLTGLLLRNTLLQGESAPFVMELPAYHVPTLRGILTHTWERLKGFLIRAGRVILVVVVILSFLNSIGTDGSFGNEDSEESVLSHIGMSITPIFTPMGIREENWPATVGLFTGIFAKEAVVGTLDSLYAGMDAEATAEEESFAFWNAIQGAFATIPEGLLGVADTFSDPLGIAVGEIEDVSSAAEAQEVSSSTFGAMIRRFDGTAGAFAYLLFILLYAPCVAALAAIWREISPGWAVFSSAYLSILAWSTSVLYYQVSTFAEHPNTSLFWLVLVSVLLGVGIFGLTRWKKRSPSVTGAMLGKSFAS
ncbi:MAG TPA: Fe(2+) transporter permease subunit FeoB [SAR324 cluster bacterium]|jgi:ferrous iron transport protein B|nr:Fe(2+) transporter permease subunit FeoB [SAR324 cluster bacterium]HJM05275.1 Fe(2+) transporter permease subunit FeoB [SAR324 cluster bacterium]